VARVLISTPILADTLEALAPHELVSSEMLDAMPALRVVSVAGAGTDAIDRAAAASRGIEILTAGEALIETTADLAFGLVIAACRQLHDVETVLRDGRWQGWRFDQTFGRDVNGATLGLVGFGAIGRAVARRALGFGMEVLHHTRHRTGEAGFVADLDGLLSGSDIVSLHVPLTGATLGLIDRRRIALMRRGAVLVNTARGAVVDEDALAEALEEGRLLAAGLDVYVGEPDVSPRLLAAPRTVLLPHVGSATAETRRAMLRLAAEKAAAFLAA
jgi:lactate dehydrogenase-like 2-hydroxyacid dehydrogenase